MTRIYLSPSNQEHNVGVGKYGTEEQRMHELAGKVARLLKARGFATRISQPQWSMAQVVADANKYNPAGIVCIHTNAGSSSADGTIGFYGSAKGKALLAAIYKYVAKESPGADEGMRSWPGLYEIRYTNAPVAYLELFFHTNYKEVADFLADSDGYAEAIARGICDYYKVPWTKPKPEPKVDYRPLKREAVKVADALKIDRKGVGVATNKKGGPFERLLRAIADYEA